MSESEGLIERILAPVSNPQSLLCEYVEPQFNSTKLHGGRFKVFWEDPSADESPWLPSPLIRATKRREVSPGWVKPCPYGKHGREGADADAYMLMGYLELMGKVEMRICALRPLPINGGKKYVAYWGCMGGKQIGLHLIEWPLRKPRMTGEILSRANVLVHTLPPPKNPHEVV